MIKPLREFATAHVCIRMQLKGVYINQKIALQGLIYHCVLNFIIFNQRLLLTIELIVAYRKSCHEFHYITL